MTGQRDSLKYLPGVKVMVEGSKNAIEAGFDEQAFQTDVELKLRMAGIRVLETEDHGLPWLYLNVNALHQKSNQQASYAISLELVQSVGLLHYPSSSPEDSPEDDLARRSMFAITWSSGVLGFGTAANARDVGRNLVDTFANDWLAVNPLNGAAQSRDALG